MVGKYVIVRGDRSGIFAGILNARSGQEVVLTDCRRIWYWEGACSLSQLAVDGTKRKEGCKFTVTVDEIMILDVLEIIPCTTKAEKSIKGVHVWKS
ncbi:MAG: hypothetical protein RR809_09105 [Lachnospiraceae bacterium]